MKKLTCLLLVILAISCQNASHRGVTVEGDLMQWHRVTLVIRGPWTSEWAPRNPFLDYKLEVTFSKDGRSITVPGYYAANGHAGVSSAADGNVWKAHFRPDEAGTWTYSVAFLKGKSIAVGDDIDGEPLAGHGTTGILEIGPTDKAGPDFRAGGRIINGGKGYFRRQGTGELWIKNGTDSPENFLAYAGFDQTSRFSLKTVVREGEADPSQHLHQYEPHLGDWKEGDPSWQGEKGKSIIGALNYLQSAGVNSVYMLTMNIIGDGKDVWPYTDHNERYRFDCSKLDQWDMVFSHMERLGIMMHFVLQETENECLLDMGHTGVQRRIYLRELVARFGDHLAVTWNLGEENGPTHWSPIGQTDAQKKEMATFLKEIHPYPCNVVLHTHSNDSMQDEYLDPMLGYENLDGPSMQVGNPTKAHERVLKWVEASRDAGKRWLVSFDELGPAWKGTMPDSHDPDHDTIRDRCLWGTLLAGGAGTEWYFGYRFPHNDLNCEDFRSRENWWKQTGIATRFMGGFPLEEMQPHDELVTVSGAYCLASPGELYLVYLPAGSGRASLKTGTDKLFSVKWFNPREGEAMVESDIKSFRGSGTHDLGEPPVDPGKDWVVVVMAQPAGG